MLEDRLYRITRKKEYCAAVHDAQAVIRRALRLHPGPVAVAVSGGKDSVAMAHLVSTQCKPLLLFTDSGVEPPESEGVVRDLAERLGLPLAIGRADAIAWVQEKGRPAAEGTAIDRACILKPTLEILKKNEIALEFVGLREEESKKRRALIRSRGPVMVTKRWGCATAFPMRRWKAADVFAYIDEHSLPLHPAYSRTDWEDRYAIRVSWVWDTDFEAKGSTAYLRKYYPDLFRRLRDAGILEVT